MDLIERLEAATGSSRELDREIAEVCGIKWSSDEEGQFGGYGLMPRRVWFTQSIDAAIQLVPDGWQWMVSNRAPEPKTGRAYIHNRELIFAGIGGMRPNPKHKAAETTAATPAIALCIAALHARTALKSALTGPEREG